MTGSSRPALGRLAKVELREAWLGEATDFTPWLAQPENVTLLGEAIGIELEIESQEQSVGPFRADILCRDTVDRHYVLIENQLERTDHTHLGQLLTYAAGLDAVTIVWLAARFTEEHRAALDWLNRATSSGFNFFGLEIELWRIGDSALAPKFNVVSKPNDWTRAVHEQASLRGEPSATEQLHFEFWTQFRQYLETRHSPIRITRPSTNYWTTAPVGRSNFNLAAWNGMRDGRSGVQLDLTGPDAKAHFQLIEQHHRDVVETRLASLGSVEWRLMPAFRASQIRVIQPGNPAGRETWPDLDKWMAEALEAMRAVFAPIVKSLNAADWVTPEEGTAAVGEAPMSGVG
ncbi:MAG: DUF4268 domain-containing protein [Candidatus Limnocylindrales bacterium]